MIVETWMTRQPLTIGLDATVREAAAIMAHHRFRHLPVVREDRLVGIVTRTDLLRGQAIDPFSSAAAEDPTAQRLVRAVMASPVVTTGPATPLEDAARLMVERKIGALPVVRDTGSLVGILTEADTLRALIDSLGVDGPHTRFVFDGRAPEALLVALATKARVLGLSIVTFHVAPAPAGREAIVIVRGRHGDRLADAAWAAGYPVRSMSERLR
jgi:acetoin utilization protein AcuB